MATPKARSKPQARTQSKVAGELPRAVAGVASLAQVTADSLEAVLEKIDGEVFEELRSIADHIQTLRREIAALQPGKMHRESIPAAGLELDAIVSATESASNTILECAEQVIAAKATDSKRYKAFVDERMLRVFEACSFQDLTGQRIAKVIETLQQIEARVARFAKVAQTDDADAARAPARAKSNTQAAVDKIIGAGAAATNGRKRR
jgi:chemotaxis protein CheZ